MPHSQNVRFYGIGVHGVFSFRGMGRTRWLDRIVGRIGAGKELLENWRGRESLFARTWHVRVPRPKSRSICHSLLRDPKPQKQIAAKHRDFYNGERMTVKP